MKFITLINVKMPKNIGILTFTNMINTTSKSLKVRNVLIFQYFSFIAVESPCSVELSMKKVL